MSSAGPAILVHTARPLVVTMHARTQGRTEFLVGGRAVAARTISADVRQAIVASGLLAEPRLVGLLGTETEHGIEALVVLLLGPDDPTGAADPLATALQAGPDLATRSPVGDDAGGERPRCVILGMVLRPEPWRLTTTLDAELQSMLRSLVGPSLDLTPDQQVIENLLGTL